MFLPLLLSFLFSLLLGPLVIKQLKRLQFGQSIREDGPASHQKKAGTPTLGGLIFIIPVFVITFALLGLSNETAFLLLLTVGHALIGFLDDFIKIKFKRNLGLTAKQKLFSQILLAITATVLLIHIGIDTTITVPSTDLTFDFGVGYFIFFLFLVIGTTNATNLTDGLDGLLAGLAVIAFSGFALISYTNNYLDVFLFTTIFIGSLLAFLFYNSNPAKVFMGDLGSLSIGGALVGIAVLTKTELLLAVIGFVFVAETLSVIIQVVSYKTRKKRVFPMTPIHHSFEQIGWSEQSVVVKFWLTGIVCAIIGVSLFLG